MVRPFRGPPPRAVAQTLICLRVPLLTRTATRLLSDTKVSVKVLVCQSGSPQSGAVTWHSSAAKPRQVAACVRALVKDIRVATVRPGLVGAAAAGRSGIVA